MELGKFLSQVDWSRVQRIHAAQNGKFYSFSVEVDRQKRLISIGMGPGTTTLTVSDMQGHILEHVVQHGQELVFYSPKPGSEPKISDALGQLAPVHIVSMNPEFDIHERGV